jgi:hypothetical protein
MGKPRIIKAISSVVKPPSGGFFVFVPRHLHASYLPLFSFWLVSRNMPGDIQHEKKIRVRLRAKKYLKSGEGLSMKIE